MSYVRTGLAGYRRVGLGAVIVPISAADADKKADALYKLVNFFQEAVKMAMAIPSHDRGPVYAALRKKMSTSSYADRRSGAWVDRLQASVPVGVLPRAAPPPVPTGPVAPLNLAMIAGGRATVASQQAAIIKPVVQPYTPPPCTNPRGCIATHVPTPEEAAAVQAARDAAVHVASHSGGQTTIVRDLRPMLAAQQQQFDPSLQAQQQLAPTGPAGGLFSNPLMLAAIGGGALLAIVLLTRKKSGPATP